MLQERGQVAAFGTLGISNEICSTGTAAAGMHRIPRRGFTTKTPFFFEEDSLISCQSLRTCHRPPNHKWLRESIVSNTSVSLKEGSNSNRSFAM